MDSYEVIVDCHLSERIARWLDSEDYANRPGGRSVLRTRPLDNAGLHGLLAQLCDLNIGIVSVRMVETAGEQGE
jgi:hypothetical protein